MNYIDYIKAHILFFYIWSLFCWTSYFLVEYFFPDYVLHLTIFNSILGFFIAFFFSIYLDLLYIKRRKISTVDVFDFIKNKDSDL